MGEGVTESPQSDAQKGMRMNHAKGGLPEGKPPFRLQILLSSLEHRKPGDHRIESNPEAITHRDQNKGCETQHPGFPLGLELSEQSNKNQRKNRCQNSCT